MPFESFTFWNCGSREDASSVIWPGSIASAIGNATAMEAVMTARDTMVCGSVAGTRGSILIMAGGTRSGKIGRKQERVVTVLKTASWPACDKGLGQN